MEEVQMTGPRVTSSRSGSGSHVALLLLALAAAGCGGGDSKPSADPANSLEGWSVLLLTLDTTRADHIGAWGHEAARTPVIDRLAAEGVRFDQAVAQAPITLPSHASILTGLYPQLHGARSNGFTALPGEVRTLAEILGESGYQTGAVVAAFVLDRRFGLSQGFDLYEDDPASMAKQSEFLDATRPASDVTQAALRVAAGFRKHRPFLLWAHYFDPHFPYTPPPDVRNEFPDTREGMYDAEIAFMDREIGVLLEGLERAGLMERTLVVVVGDHGEGFPGPHEEESHGLFLYEDTLRIPLVFSARGAWDAPRAIDRLVRQVDILPTVLDLVGVENRAPLNGVSLRGLLEGSEEALPDPVSYAETIAPWISYGWASLYQVRTSRWKYIDAPKPELYDLVEDPEESRNLAAELPDKVRELHEMLEAILSGKTAAGAGRSIDEGELARLRALGYAGTPPQSIDPLRGEENRKLRNPGDWIGLHIRIKQADSLFLSRRTDEAIAQMSRLLDEDPNNYEINNRLGKYHETRGDLEQAARMYTRLTQLRPELAFGYDRLADVQETLCGKYRAEGDPEAAGRMLDEAVANWEKAISLNTLELSPMLRLGAVHLQRQEYARAEEVLRKAHALSARDYDANHLLGAAIMMQRRMREARGFLETSLALARGKPEQQKLAQAKLADVYHDLGEHAKAIECVEWIIRSFPSDPNMPKLRSILDKLNQEMDGK